MKHRSNQSSQMVKEGRQAQANRIRSVGVFLSFKKKKEKKPICAAELSVCEKRRLDSAGDWSLLFIYK